MEQDKISEAIHKLELALTERIHLQTVSLEVNNERLDNLRIAVDRHREILFGHDDGEHLGLVAEMTALRKVERERRWTVRTVTSAFMIMVGKFCWDLWTI